MAAALGLLNKLDNISDEEADVWTIDNGSPSSVAYESLEIRGLKKKPRNGVTGVALVSYGNELASVTRNEIAAFEACTGGAWFKTASTYRGVKQMQEWRKLYGVKPDDFYYLSFHTGRPFKKHVDGVYCRACGVKMPLKMATVDHQMPQNNGANLALCRFFRALGCTKGPGHGMKTQAYQQQIAASVGGKTDNDATDKASRYTLNRVGRIYYSLLAAEHDWRTTMADRCLHSIFNLRPVCGPCNSKIGDSAAANF